MASVITPAATELMSGEDFARTDVPDYYELVRGRIVPMPPPNMNYGLIEMNIGGQIYMFLQSHPFGRLVGGDSGVYTSRAPDTVRGADLYYITKERLAKRDPSKAYLDVAPDWITEVLSPSNTEAYIQEKLAEYFDIGVRMVWLVDPEARVVQVYRSLSDVRTFRESDVITGEDVLPGFSVQVARFFENL